MLAIQLAIIVTGYKKAWRGGVLEMMPGTGRFTRLKRPRDVLNGIEWRVPDRIYTVALLLYDGKTHGPGGAQAMITARCGNGQKGECLRF
jgi:hypothetical protein